MLKQEAKGQGINSESDSGIGPQRLQPQRSSPPSADLWTLTCAQACSAAIQGRPKRSSRGEISHAWRMKNTPEPYIFCKRACWFNTYTVGLWRPLWSLAVGDGLCPAASEADTAPTEEDCGGGGGGGGKVSWNEWEHGDAKLSHTSHSSVPISYLLNARSNTTESIFLIDTEAASYDSDTIIRHPELVPVTHFILTEHWDVSAELLAVYKVFLYAPISKV